MTSELVARVQSSQSVRNNFGFPFCQSLWDLTKRRDDIAVADMAADIEMHMVADMEVDNNLDQKSIYFLPISFHL